MNGKASKRLRIVARILDPKDEVNRRHTVNRLKQEYKALPLHKRNHPLWESHSAALKRYHKAQGH